MDRDSMDQDSHEPRKSGVEFSIEPQQQLPDVSYEQRAATEIIKRIRKLRWMGMQEPVERL